MSRKVTLTQINYWFSRYPEDNRLWWQFYAFFFFFCCYLFAVCDMEIDWSKQMAQLLGLAHTIRKSISLNSWSLCYQKPAGSWRMWQRSLPYCYCSQWFFFECFIVTFCRLYYFPAHAEMRWPADYQHRDLALKTYSTRTAHFAAFLPTFSIDS